MMFRSMVCKYLLLGRIAKLRTDMIATRYPSVEYTFATGVLWYMASEIVGGRAPLTIIMSIPALIPDLAQALENIEASFAADAS